MTKIVQGSFHPAVEHNAMLIIGDLNDTEYRMLVAERYPAVRLGRALDFMLAQLKRPDISDSLRLAAYDRRLAARVTGSEATVRISR